MVASFTGAWIETLDLYHEELKNVVASFTGAWIETYIPGPRVMSSSRRILYGCVD